MKSQIETEQAGINQGPKHKTLEHRASPQARPRGRETPSAGFGAPSGFDGAGSLVP